MMEEPMMGDDCITTGGSDGIVDCEMGCTPVSWIGDFMCDSALACDALGWDADTCSPGVGDGCTTDDGDDGVYDCDTMCGMGPTADDMCEAAYDCADFDYDGGECAAPVTGDDCTTAYGSAGFIDCDGGCSSAAWVSDDYCDDIFDCEEMAWDGGDCLDVMGACAMEDGADGVYDCDKACLADTTADGACDTAFDCMDAGYDGGDCAGCLDTDAGAADSWGDTCAEYYAFPSWCGGFDTADFDSMSMCCACGGGE
jgi:hypothetical protein